MPSTRETMGTTKDVQPKPTMLIDPHFVFIEDAYRRERFLRVRRLYAPKEMPSQTSIRRNNPREPLTQGWVRVAVR